MIDTAGSATAVISHIGLIGDVHAEDSNLAATLDFLSTLHLDAILCTGDIVDGPGDPNLCAHLLADANVHCVRGNHDRWLLADQMRHLPEATTLDSMSIDLRDYLLSLPPTMDFNTPRGELILCHGVGTNDMRRLTPDDFGYALTSNDELQDIIAARRYAFMIAGHTHRQMVRSFERLTVVNPGTLLTRHEPGFATIDLTPGSIQFYTLDDRGRVTTGVTSRMPA